MEIQRKKKKKQKKNKPWFDKNPKHEDDEYILEHITETENHPRLLQEQYVLLITPLYTTRYATRDSRVQWSIFGSVYTKYGENEQSVWPSTERTLDP